MSDDRGAGLGYHWARLSVPVVPGFGSVGDWSSRRVSVEKYRDTDPCRGEIDARSTPKPDTRVLTCVMEAYSISTDNGYNHKPRGLSYAHCKTLVKPDLFGGRGDDKKLLKKHHQI